MIVKLAFKLFLSSSKRTVRGAQIIAISLVAITSTSMLITSFNTEISKLTSSISNESEFIQVKPINSDIFSTDQTDKLIEFGLSEEDVVDYFLEFRDIGIIDTVEVNISIPLHFVNMTKFFPNLEVIDLNSVVSTDNFNDYIEENEFYNLNYRNNQSVVLVADFVESTREIINSGLYLDFEQFNVTHISNIFIQISSPSRYERVKQKLENFDFLTIIDETAENRFLEDSTREVTKTLTLLLIFISILMYFSISNIIKIVIDESKYEIRTLKSIGYEIKQIKLIFYIISGLIGILGSILTIIFSLLLTNLISGAIVLLSDLNFIFSTITWKIFLTTIIPGILIPLISSYIPILREVK